MATVTPGYTFISNEVATPTKLNQAATPTVSVANDEITTAKILNAAVTTAKIADSNVTTAKIADSNVTTAKIADDAVTAAKLDGIASINQQTGNYTLVLADAGRVIEVNSASNITVTIPANATAAFATGATIIVTRRGAGDVTLAGAVGVTLRSGGSRLKIGQQYAAVAVQKIGTDEWLVLGDLKA